MVLCVFLDFIYKATLGHHVGIDDKVGAETFQVMLFLPTTNAKQILIRFRFLVAL